MNNGLKYQEGGTRYNIILAESRNELTWKV